MSPLPYYAESIFLTPSKHSRSRLFLPCFPKTSWGCKKRILPQLCFFCLAVPLTRYSRYIVMEDNQYKTLMRYPSTSRNFVEPTTSCNCLTSMYSRYRRANWIARSMVDGSRSDSPGNTTNGQTRLFRALQSFRIKLTTKLKILRKDLPVKVLFFLVGFYCATAFATVIGQTGDWDILSAGLAVVVVEGIGALMYRTSFPLLSRIKSLVTMFNYWKAGLSLGLFLDAFKYEMDMLMGSFEPFNIDIDMFPVFW